MKLDVYKCNLCGRVWDEKQVHGVEVEINHEQEPEIFLVQDPKESDDHICLACINCIKATEIEE